MLSSIRDEEIASASTNPVAESEALGNPYHGAIAGAVIVPANRNKRKEIVANCRPVNVGAARRKRHCQADVSAGPVHPELFPLVTSN